MEGSMAKRVSACGARAQAIGKQKVSYASLFWLFLIGSVTGFVLEGLWCIVRKGHWESHTATVWGPFCVIYGVGAVAVDLLAVLLRGRHPVQQFLAFSASGAAVEYFGSLFQERCFGTFSWDYSQDFLNLGGRVSLQTALVWGALGLLFVWLAFPGISRLLQRMRGRAWRVACAALSVFLAADLLVTSAALVRWRRRAEGAGPAANPVVRWIDASFGDEAMAARFPNMRFCGAETPPPSALPKAEQGFGA